MDEVYELSYILQWKSPPSC